MKNKYNSKKEKNNISILVKIELKKKGIIFWKNIMFLQKLETDLILILNEKLQQLYL